jgi:hypothetical protein
MTHGTMPGTLLELDGENGGPAQPGRGRAGLKVAAAAVVVALIAGGAYVVFGGGSPAADTSTTKTSAGKSSGRTPAQKAADAKASADEMTAPAQAGTPAKAKPAVKPKALPSAKNMTTAQKRTALVAYLKDGSFPLTADSSPATAAKGACTLLDGGMKTDKLITELSRGAGVTAAQGRYFLVGATHFYCSKYTVAP